MQWLATCFDRPITTEQWVWSSLGVPYFGPCATYKLHFENQHNEKEGLENLTLTGHINVNVPRNVFVWMDVEVGVWWQQDKCYWDRHRISSREAPWSPTLCTDTTYRRYSHQRIFLFWWAFETLPQNRVFRYETRVSVLRWLIMQIIFLDFQLAVTVD